MEPVVNAILTNEEGWQKQYRLEEGVYLVGSADDAKLRLPQAELIAPYHLQMVNSGRETHVRLVNLSGFDMRLETGAQEIIFPPGAFRDVFGGEVLYLGPYTLQWEIHKQYVPKEVAQEQNQKVIGLRMVLSGQVLHPDEVVTGTLYLRNLGSQACQFLVEIEGLPRECYEIDPPPLIHAGGEESTAIRFYHRRVAPPAGNNTFTLRVSAPTVYPGRELSVQQTLKVFPSYRHSLSWSQDTGAAAPVQPAQPQAPPAPPAPPVEAPGPRRPDWATLLDEAQASPAEAQIEPLPAPPELDAPPLPEPEPLPDRAEAGPSQPEEPFPFTPAPRLKRPDLSGLKVMRASSGEFLEEKGKQP